jgi:hypothetical protein
MVSNLSEFPVRFACTVCIPPAYSSQPSKTCLIVPVQSGDVLASIATFALKSRLSNYEHVDARIICTVPELLRGQVQGVKILGSGW